MKLNDEVSTRIKLLRKNMLVAPEVCVEKAYYTTETFKATEGAPIEYRRAKVLENILSHLTIGIGDGELFVGRPTGKVRGGSMSPEVNSTWYVKEMDTFSTRNEEHYSEIPENEKQIIRDVCEYWKGKSLYDHWHGFIPEEMKKYNGPIIAGGGFCLNTQYFGHIATNFEKILKKGVSGILADIDKSIESIGTFADVNNFEKIQYLKSMKISLNAVVIFANRYADLAEKMECEEKDPKRKIELSRIKNTCRRVPEFPARNLYEAIQSTWFTYVALNNEAWGAGPSMARADQYLYSYYKADKEAGLISDEDALEYISCFLIKMNGQFTVYSNFAASIFGGLCCRIGTTIGGLNSDGTTAVNELSRIFLDAEWCSGLTEDLMILIGEKTPQDFLEQSIELAKHLRGKLKFIGENVLVNQMLVDGRPLELARTCAITGCNSPSIPGHSLDLPGGMVNLCLIFDLALHDGYSPMLKMQMGPHTGDARTFTDYDQVFEAFRKQFAYFVPYMHLYKNMDKKMFADYSPCLLQSAMMEGCIEQALDITRGAMKYKSYSISLSGAPNIGDSLAVIKKLIFEDKRYNMKQMMDAIDSNFDGDRWGALHHDIERVPKFGNDIPYVDNLVNDVMSYCSDEVAKYLGFCGAKSNVAAATITSNIPMGYDVGALPDGRLAGVPIAEGGISPFQGRNISGMTSTLASVAKLDHMKMRHGSVLNLRINPDALKDNDKIKKLSNLVRSFHAMGGFLVQFNIVSTDMLKDAQNNPENYKDLLVRVSTYSAYFVELSRQLQDDIIARLEIENF